MTMTTRVQELERYICTLYETKDQLKQHIFARADRAFRAGDEARDRVRDLASLADRQQAMKQAMVEAVGGLPPSDTPLNATVTDRVAGEGYTVENIVFEARPQHYVTGNLYLPGHGRQGEPGAAVLFLSGHEPDAKHSPYYHEVCLRMVQAGLIVFAIDPIGQGERLGMLTAADGSTVWGTAEHQRLGVQCYALGQSIARLFIHDAMRAIDYLETRPEVDPSRIGVTGNSGGGTQTAMMMVCDDRVAAAAPATFIMNRQQYMHAGGVQDAEQIWPGLSGLGFDHEDLLLAFAPKPLLVCAVQYDFFPIEATRRTVQRSRKFWELHGCGELLRLEEDRSTHRYTDPLAIAAADFFAQHLAKRTDTERRAYLEQAALGRLAPLEPWQLQCTASRQVQLEYADACTAADAFKTSAVQLAAGRSGHEAGASWLAQRVFASRERCGLNARFVQLDSCDGLDVHYAMWWSQHDIMNSGYWFRATEAGSNDAAQKLPKQPESVTIALWPHGTTNLAAHWSWIQSTCASGSAVLVLNVSGVGPHEPHPLYGKPSHRFFGIHHKLADELIWLGDSLAAMRTYDVIRGIDFVASLYGEADAKPEISLYAAGLFRIYAEAAAAVDRRVKTVEAQSSPVRMQDWLASGIENDEDVMSVIIPGLLHYYDFPV